MTDRAEPGLREAVRAALNELGVPGPGYPAPVANAVDILTAALAATEPDGLDEDRLARALEGSKNYLGALTRRFGRFNGAWYDKAANEIATEYARLAEQDRS